MRNILNTIAIDVMGGDNGPLCVLQGVSLALKNNPDLSVVLAAENAIIEQFEIEWQQKWGDRCEWLSCGESILMEDAPSSVLRSKKNASLREILNLVAQEKAGGCVSSGNTGALMALSRLILKTLPGIDRPAIVRALPSVSGRTYMLDLGANISATAENLFQFAVMGHALYSAVEPHNQKPKMGLLNVGVEQIKGHDSVRHASTLLEKSDLNYIGFVEGNDIFLGDVDIIITDGFTGNTVLKACEGLSSFVLAKVKQSLPKSLLKLSSWFGRGKTGGFQTELNPENYNGASLLGVNGVVVKSHGSSSSRGISIAISAALAESRAQIPARIAEYLESVPE